MGLNHPLNSPDEGKSIKVGVVRIPRVIYPKEAPYHPSVAYPEYPFPDFLSTKANYVYEGVRQLFYELGYDRGHWDTPRWNPLGPWIKPKMTVVLKPNFVISRHPAGKDIFSIITHPSILRAIIDYCWIAMQGTGKIIIADAPQYNCNFRELLDVTKLEAISAFYSRYPSFTVEILDLRSYWSEKRHFPSMLRLLPGDPQGAVTVNLGRKSAFYRHSNPEKLYGAVYHRQELIRRHFHEKQDYEISGTILKADVFISVPKMKVHKKVGVTLNMKGLVGICTNKNLCVHYTIGSPKQGGDQYPEDLFTPMERSLIKLERWMYDHLLARQKIWLEYIHRSAYFLHRLFLKPLGIAVDPEKRQMEAGNWYGNDSAWRMVKDLLQIIYFADREGNLQETKQRPLLSIVDGIIGGENNGPLEPDPIPVGVILGGDHLVAVDLVATKIMGFDFRKIKMFSVLEDPALSFGLAGISAIQICSNDDNLKYCLENGTRPITAFHPPAGWRGHIEIHPIQEERHV